MVSPRLTFNVKNWIEGEIVSDRPDLQARYGVQAAGLVVMAGERLKWATKGGGPSAQDIKHTLSEIERCPALALSNGFPGQLAGALLVAETYRRCRRIDLSRMPADEIAAAASDALRNFKTESGRPKTEPIIVQLVRDLLTIAPVDKRARDAMLKDCLSAAMGTDISPKRLEALQTEARGTKGSRRAERAAPWVNVAGGDLQSAWRPIANNSDLPIDRGDGESGAG
jgi:hypothetical protein